MVVNRRQANEADSKTVEEMLPNTTEQQKRRMMLKSD
jgi:hypothetical protein